MSTSPVSYCWAMAGTRPSGSRFSRSAILGSRLDGRGSDMTRSLLQGRAAPDGANRRPRPGPGGRDARDTKGPASRREGGPFTYDYRLPVLQGDDLVSLRTPVTLRHLELDALVLVQRAVPAGPDGRVVHEAVRPAAVDSDESEALLGVEPLHGALLGHVFLLAAKPGPTPRGPVRSLRYALAPRYGPGKAKTPAAISPRASGRTIENHDCNRRPHRITASA